MFKKPKDVESKNVGKLRGKELKKLRADAAKAFPPLAADPAALDLLLPLKGHDVSLMKLGGGTRTQLFCVDGAAVLVDSGEKGGSLFPTLAG